MPAQLYQSPTGHELEIIPLSDISRFSEDVKLKVLYKTSPLAGAIMELDSVSYLKSSRHTHAVEHKHPVHKAELTFVTNEDGIVTVPSLHIGQWLAKVQNKKSFQDKSLCVLLTDAQGAWFEHDLHALSEQQKGKRAARTVLTGMCYSVGSATRQGSNSPTRFIGQSAMTSRT